MRGNEPKNAVLGRSGSVTPDEFVGGRMRLIFESGLRRGETRDHKSQHWVVGVGRKSKGRSGGWRELKEIADAAPLW